MEALLAAIDQSVPMAYLPVKFDSSDGPCWRNMKWLVWALKVNEGLTGLGLNGNILQLTGMNWLIAALEFNKRLTSLSLRDTGLESAGFDLLMYALQHNTSLTSLSLYGNRFYAWQMLHLGEVVKLDDRLVSYADGELVRCGVSVDDDLDAQLKAVLSKTALHSRASCGAEKPTGVALPAISRSGSESLSATSAAKVEELQTELANERASLNREREASAAACARAEGAEAASSRCQIELVAMRVKLNLACKKHGDERSNSARLLIELNTELEKVKNELADLQVDIAKIRGDHDAVSALSLEHLEQLEAEALEYHARIRRRRITMALEQEKNNHCIVCFEAPRNATLVPCGHLVCCFPCASRLPASISAPRCCPTCRSPIAQIIKTYG